LAWLALRQHGVVTAAQLSHVGLTDGAVCKRERAGRLHRVHRGVYAVGHAKLSREGRWMAAVLAAGEGAVLGGVSAAELWQIWRHRSDVSVIVSPRRHRPQTGISFRHCRALDPRDVTRRFGIPVTTVARTQVDLSDTLTPHQLAYVIHEADFRNRFNPDTTRAAMARASGRHRMFALERALELHFEGSAGTRSDYEDMFLKVVATAGLPEPITNVRREGLEVDFRWPGLCVEVDGGGHTRPATRREDRRRDAQLKADGYTILRFTADDVENFPTAVLARTIEALPHPSPSPDAVR
jgi:hypothetical protein